MKKIIVLILFVLTQLSCDTEATLDCLQSSDQTELRDLNISNLEQITIRENIRLEITFSEVDEVKVEGGDKHLDKLEVIQNDSAYEFKTNGLCKTGFSEAPIVIRLKSSKLNRVRNSSQFEVISTNVLEFPELSLISEDSNQSEALNLGNFTIEVDNERLNVVGNGISDFRISGKTQLFNFGTFSGSGTVLARELEVETITFFHRSFRDAVVNPSQRLEGELRSSGNLISIKKPPQVEVEEFYTGKLIFE
ncbi:GIN domain-containing protein [Psychroflexus tropicus]|uniref:GIN domain-containing protein n=1 Tax=Psychroflexus tropicus TaxID=197345 RepID=UPI000361951F|nr:DUF2807 domain-containing protein [Psychroflexus tropicus]